MARDERVQVADDRHAEAPKGSDDRRAQPAASEPALAGAPSPAADELEKAQRLVLQLERQNRRLRKRCEEAEVEIDYLERKLKSTEDTLSFRLGYALIHSTKSLQAMRSLPSVLRELSRDSARRRQQSWAGTALNVLRAQAGRLTKPRPGRRKPEDP
jgi:predicted RNase H-like nuclease (RuvC/YqgF family)